MLELVSKDADTVLSSIGLAHPWHKHALHKTVDVQKAVRVSGLVRIHDDFPHVPRDEVARVPVFILS